VKVRNQKQPAQWIKETKEYKPDKNVFSSKSWIKFKPTQAFLPNGGTLVKYGENQIAIFYFKEKNEWYSSQNLCPHKMDMVLSRGMIGEKGGVPKVACPQHKKNFSLQDGSCLTGEDYEIFTFPVKVEDGTIYVELPPEQELHDAIHQTTKEACLTPA